MSSVVRRTVRKAENVALMIQMEYINEIHTEMRAPVANAILKSCHAKAIQRPAGML